MILRLFIILLILHFGFTKSAVGQEGPESIKVIAMVQEENILLRWAPSDAAAWRLLNKYGYSIIREAIVKDDVLVKPIQPIIIRENLSPQPLGEWESFVAENDYAAIAAQAIYGRTFNVTSNETDVVSMINNAEDEQQRLSMAQLASDHDFRTAQMSGLAFQDTSVISGERYLYKIISNVPAHIKSIRTGYVYIGLMDSTALPIPEAPAISQEDGRVRVSWNTDQYGRSYNYFFIERSNGNDTFERISELTHVSLSNQDHAASLSYTFDKLPQEFIQPNYRLRGVNAFGITGPPSEAISFISSGNALKNPAIVSHSLNDSNWVELIYETNNLSGLKQSYTLQRSDKYDGDYVPIGEKTVGGSKEAFVDTNPTQVNYYKITVFNKAGQRKSSMPFMVQIEDNIPPNSPVGLECSVDSIGKVQLKWKRNEEADLKGYFVYGSNGPSQEFSLLGKGLLEDTSFVESISLATLSKNRFYCVNAVDNRLNASTCSDTITVHRPDVIPPTPPVWLGYEETTNGIELSWLPSSSKDTKEYVIHRKAVGRDLFKVIGKKAYLDSSSVQFIDTTFQESGMYQYTLVACDSSGNCSKKVIPITIKKELDESELIIEKFLAKPNFENSRVHLTWSILETSDSYSFGLYRRQSDKSYRLIANLNSRQLEYYDSSIIPEKSYTYLLRVFSDNGEAIDQRSYQVDL